MKKKILLITKSFYPVSGPRSTRATELVKALAANGCLVKVLTPYNAHHAKFSEEYHIEIEDLGKHFFNKSRKNTTSVFAIKVVLKLMSLIKISKKYNLPDVLYKNLTFNKIKEYKNWDLLISIAKPHAIHWGIAKALEWNSKITKKWIADCGDPFMGNPFHKPSPLFEKFERNFCEVADIIAVPIPEATESYYLEYRDKIKVIPQGFDFKKDLENIAEYKKNVVPTFCYSGVFYKENRDPRNLLEYLISLHIIYKFIIYTTSNKLIQPYVDRSNGRIEIREYIPRNELLNELSKMDFLININNMSCVQSPSKLVDYYLSGRPVLSLGTYEVNELIIEEFLNYSFENKLEYTNMKRYDIRNVVTRFLE
jgi:hypothetical protein